MTAHLIGAPVCRFPEARFIPPNEVSGVGTLGVSSSIQPAGRIKFARFHLNHSAGTGCSLANSSSDSSVSRSVRAKRTITS